MCPFIRHKKDKKRKRKAAHHSNQFFSFEFNISKFRCQRDHHEKAQIHAATGEGQCLSTTRSLSLSQIAYAPNALKMLQALWFVLAILLMKPPLELNRGNSPPLWTSVTSSLGFINFPKLVLQPLAEADYLGATFIISWYDCLEEVSASNWSSKRSNSASNSASTSSIPSTGSCLDSHPLDWFDCMSMLFWQKRERSMGLFQKVTAAAQDFLYISEKRGNTFRQLRWFTRRIFPLYFFFHVL